MLLTFLGERNTKGWREQMDSTGFFYVLFFITFVGFDFWGNITVLLTFLRQGTLKGGGQHRLFFYVLFLLFFGVFFLIFLGDLSFF